jgi:hypothetical protein
MPKTKIHLSNKKIGYFIIDNRGKIIETGDEEHQSDWERTYVEMDKSKMNNDVFVSFNKRENEKIGKQPVYRPILNCKIIKLEQL